MIRYAITPSFILKEEFLESYLSNLSSKADMVLFRDKTNPNYAYDAKFFIQKAKANHIPKVLLHQDIDLAIELKADGIHLNATQFHQIQKAKANKLLTIISTHSIEEGLLAKKLGADMVCFSPIFHTPHKGEPKGIEVLNEFCMQVDNLQVIALGGIISDEHIALINASKAVGFASIRFFLK